MLVIIWITLFFINAACMHQTLTRRLPVMLGALLGLILSIVLAFGALDLVVVSGGSVALTDASRGLALLCVGGMVVDIGLLFASFTGQLPTGSPSERSDI